MTDEVQANEAATGADQREEAETAAEASQAAAAEAAKAGEGAKPAPTIAGGAGSGDAGAAKPADGGDGKPEGNDTGWPDDWRARLAGDDKKVLKTLDRFTSPEQMLGSYLDMRSRFDSGEFVKKPADDASDEEKAAFRKALGIPEKAADYIDNLALPDGVAMSKEDKEVLGQFAEKAHAAGAPQAVIDAAGSWYLDYQREQADALDKQDAEHATTAGKELRDEWRGDFDRNVNAGRLLFKDAPGGTDASGDGLFARLMGGRMADGTLIGNDPTMLRWLASTGREMNPAATVTGAGNGSPASVDSRMKEIEGWMQAGDAKYWKDEAVQSEYRELIDARQKMNARG